MSASAAADATAGLTSPASVVADETVMCTPPALVDMRLRVSAACMRIATHTSVAHVQFRCLDNFGRASLPPARPRGSTHAGFRHARVVGAVCIPYVQLEARTEEVRSLQAAVLLTPHRLASP
jgi:hypothetical protein